MDILGKQLYALTVDNRVGPVHLCMFVALLQCREGSDMEKFFITRGELMRLARIQGRTTYFKVMKELAEWGYISYEPSKDPAGRGKVRIMSILTNI